MLLLQKLKYVVYLIPICTFVIESAENVNGIRCFVEHWHQIILLKDLICYKLVVIDWIENRLIY